MAAPFSLEDLTKLKSFVEFVAANPTILNLPELDFFKKLIEDLGGIVPEGTFQMPAGAKCPFGGDVKSESKSTPPPATAEEEIPEMEADSEESEVELDMEANNMTVLEPNILYLDEKPPKIVKTKKITTFKKSTKTARNKRKATKKLIKKRPGKLKHDYVVKKELSSEENQEKLENNDPDDPLYTAKLEIKCELGEENQNESNEYDCGFMEQKDAVDGDQDYNYEDDMKVSKLEKSAQNDDDEEDDDDDVEDDDEYDDTENEEEEDEPLIMLTRRKGRPRKKRRPYDEKIKAPRNVVCREICKQHCTEKFNEKERKSICDYFWNLSKEERLAFIRKHTRARRLTRMKRVNAVRSRGNNSCYYLKNYSIGKDETTPALSTDLTRVCRKFFEATLCTTNHYIKKANDGSILEIEKDLQLLHEIKLAKEKEKLKEPKQILDPETGNLITIDPKTKQTPKPKPPEDKNAAKKRVRRKRGDPEPEHFPKPIICVQRCIHKCHTKFTEEERKQICDFFWSMDYKRRKDFILANMEIKDIETETTPDFRKTNRPPRAYQSRFYMRSGGTRGEKLRVCKDFYVKTLCINRYFIENAIEFADKTTGYYTGTDRRGIHGAPNKISDDRKQTVLDHIESYPYWLPHKKSKTKYLHHSLTIKKMFETYKDKAVVENIEHVSLHYYYKLFHAHFNVLFLANPHPKKGGGFLKANPNISHYTGEEVGGYWIDYKAKNSQPILEPIYCLEEKPLKIVEKLKSARRKISNKGGIRKKTILKTRKNRTIKNKNTKLQDKVKLEYNLNEGDEKEDIKYAITNDPLFTPQIQVKCELNEEDAEIYFDSDDDKDFCMEEYEDDDEDEDYEINTKKQMCSKTKLEDNESDMKDDDDDEPLILLTQRSTRKKYKKKTTPSLKSCGDSCKYKCTIKFDRQQRFDILNYYLHLNEADKVNFIRKHIRKPILKILRSKGSRHNCCYFLKHYQIGKTQDTKQLEETQAATVDNNTTLGDDEDLTKVCRKFFDSTLRISDKEIKEAIKGYELKLERIVRPPKKEEKCKGANKLIKTNPTKTQQPQQYLDPETGDLTNTKPKKKTKRRKRGEPLPERFPKPINCAIRCIFKCHEKFSEVERKQICDIFWSLDFKRRKDFILARIETTDVKTSITPEYRKTNRPTRAYQTKFYLRSGPKSENIRVCKHFMLNTLCINRWFVENAIEFADKTTGAYTGTDRRGLTGGGNNKIPDDRRQTVLDHIDSYPFWIPNKKCKTKYLHYSLNIKKMFDAYKEKCVAENIDYVHVHYYYQVFHSHFNLLFLASPHPKKGRGYYKTNPNISHYTGEEAGGCWIDSKGNKLDIRSINPALTLDISRNNLASDSKITSFVPDAFASGSGVHALNISHNPISVLALKSIVDQQPSLAMARSDLSPASYENLPADTVNMFRML